ncbi:MAG TPA: hypothetical protein DCO75_05020 [Fibrobacteres bacterium]|jgi:hypothetical protein|nr:hypothetical protein [Fibrobacterota bacterium]
MILPTKHISTQQSLLGLGATMLKHLTAPTTVTGLWDKIRSLPEIGTYKRFILTLDLLFTINAIDYTEGLLQRRGK